MIEHGIAFHIFLFAVIFAFSPNAIALGAPFINTPHAVLSTTTLTSTDIDVILTICNDLRRSDSGEGTFLAILDELIPPKPKFTVFLPAFIAEGITSDTLKIRLIKRNREAFLVTDRITSGNITLIGNEELNQLINKKQFEQQFPRFVGYADFWLPSYKDNSTKALVYVFCRGSEGSDMWGRLYHLRRSKDAWAVISSELLWRT